MSSIEGLCLNGFGGFGQLFAGRLGVGTDIRDIAFDSLFTALDQQQIDVAIAAISVTPEREQLANFSTVYYVGEEGILAQANSAITTITTLSDLAGRRIGVQRGSVYETWLQRDLVDTGLTQASNIFVYETVDAAVRDLREAGAARWQTVFPEPPEPGLPQPRTAYLRAGRFTGGPGDDLYVWAGTPSVRSAVLDGRTGAIVWERCQAPGSERYWGPSVNLASVYDVNADGNDDLVFTNPDYYWGYNNPKFNALYKKINNAPRADERNKLLGEAQQMLANDAVNGFLFQPQLPTVADKRLKGVWKDMPTFVNDLSTIYWS